MLNEPASGNVPKKSFGHNLIAKKLSAPVLILFLIFSSLVVSFIIAREGYGAGVIILCVIVAIPAAWAIIVYPEFGIAALIFCSFFINFSSRFLPEPTQNGLVMDAIIYLLILGFFIRQKKERDWSYFKNPITYIILIWLFYNLFEIINPYSPSVLEWIFTVRTVGFIMILYFVFVYNIRSKKFIVLLFKLWLLLELVAAISAFQQEHIGLFSFEREWLYRFPGRFKLLFIGGHLRKWGIFSDPVVFAYNMVMAALLCITLILRKVTNYKKLILGALGIFFIMVMLYSGTRSSYLIIPATMVMLSILNFSKTTFAFIAVGALALGLLIAVHTSSPVLARFQSAFRPLKDASFQERARNQAEIKPYILSHPIGGGLGSTGIWGARFAPNSYLAKFPPDSGYERVAVETGWIGLFLYCLFNFVILYKGIGYYFLIKDPELKSYCLAMVLIIFALVIGNFTQQSVVQYPNSILYFLAVAILNVTMRLDIEQRNVKLYLAG